ncbi:MAG: pyridoxal phosphate-dependent aminotransferase [Myxococcota bacterium]|nr:pyridoxal phosphate-dependent aminotransferase [Myxococcota bacterium]
MANALFDDESVPLKLLSERAYNYRWAETDEGVIPLTAADPDFAVAREIRDAITRYAQEGVFSYGPNRGLPSLRNAMARELSSRNYGGIDAERILPLDSAASCMFTVARAFMKQGDEMIIFDPVDYLFEQAATAAGGGIKRCPYDHETGNFRLDELERLVTDRTRMIGVCNPHNPLGRLIKQDELEAIARFAQKHDLWILNDEVWSDIVFQPQKFSSFHHLASPLRDRVITVHGFSKSFGLAGLRIGTILAPCAASFTELLNASQVMSTAGGASTLSQVAATAALEHCRYWVDDFVGHLQGLRDLAIERLNAMPGVSCESPEATYLLFPDIRATGLGSDAITDYLGTAARVAVIPGNDRFFGPGGAGHIRLCFATSREILVEALDRMDAAMHSLAQSRNRG